MMPVVLNTPMNKIKDSEASLAVLFSLYGGTVSGSLTWRHSQGNETNVRMTVSEGDRMSVQNSSVLHV